MKKFFGEILVLLGSIALTLIPLAGGITILVALFRHELDILTLSNYPLGWVALLLTLFTHIYSFVYSVLALRIISLGRSSKKSLYVSLPFIVIEIFRVIYVYILIGDFPYINLFTTIVILTFIFYSIQLGGFILNYKKQI